MSNTETETPTSTEIAVADRTQTIVIQQAPFDFDAAWRMAEVLAKSSLVPSAYRQKPENVLLATMFGVPYGWDPTMSMRSVHIIEGVPSMKPEIMLALVRRAGHSVSGDSNDTSATITGTRRDTGDTMSFSFSIWDAERAGLCRVVDGKAASKSSSGKVLPWQQYPASMCWARALSQLCRMLFPDVVLGAGYTPEELGAQDNDTPQRVQATHTPSRPTAPEGQVDVVEAKARLVAAYEAAGFVRAEAITYAGAMWQSESLPAKGEADSIEQGAFAAVLAKVAAELSGPDADGAEPDTGDDDIIDAELVEDTTEVQS